MKRIEPTISGLTQDAEHPLDIDNALEYDMYLSPEDMIDSGNGNSNNKNIIVLNAVIMLIGVVYTLLSFVAIQKLTLSGSTAIVPLMFGLFIIASGYVPYYSVKYAVPKKNKIMGIVFNFLCAFMFVVLSIAFLLLDNVNLLYSLISFLLSFPFLFNIFYLIKQ